MAAGRYDEQLANGNEAQQVAEQDEEENRPQKRREPVGMVPECRPEDLFTQELQDLRKR